MIMPSKRISSQHYVLLITLFVIVITTGGCYHGIADLMTPRELVDFFKPPWVVISLPSSLYHAGAVVEVAEGKGVKWLGDGRPCFTGGILTPQKGATPSWTFTKQPTFSAKIVANIKGITVGPEFSTEGKVSMKIDAAEVEVIDVIKLWDWMQTNRDKIPKACQDFLLMKDSYLVGEAYRVDKATYTLYDKSGAKLNLGGEKLKDLLKVSAGVKGEITTDGALSISAPVYIAFRRLKFTGPSDRPEVLGGSSAEQEGDAILRKHYDRDLEGAFGFK